MKRVGVLVAIFLLFELSPAYALNFEDVKAGITPDNPLWKLDKWEEKLELLVTFNKEKKVEKRIKFAEERLAEAEEMVKKNKTEHVEKALEEQEKLLLEAQEDMPDDLTGLHRAIAVIEEHKKRVEERKQELLATLPEDSPARERIEEKFEKMEEHADKVIEHLEEVKAKKSEKITAVLANITQATGIDAKSEYEQLMTEGKVSDNAINTALNYVNEQVRASNISLSPLEGKTIAVNIVMEDDQITQTIYVGVSGGQFVRLSGGAVDKEVKIEVEDIPEYLEKLAEKDEKWALLEISKKLGKDTFLLAKEYLEAVREEKERAMKTHMEEGQNNEENEQNDGIVSEMGRAIGKQGKHGD